MVAHEHTSLSHPEAALRYTVEELQGKRLPEVPAVDVYTEHTLSWSEKVSELCQLSRFDPRYL